MHRSINSPRRSGWLLSAALVAPLLAGCSGYAVASASAPLVPATAPAPAGLAKVCVFRTSTIGAALTTPVRDNGRVVGATDGPGHFCYFAGPGHHTLTVEVSDAPAFAFEVAEGDVRYIEHEINIGRDALVPIGAAQAAELAASTEYTVIDEAPPEEELPPVVVTVGGL